MNPQAPSIPNVALDLAFAVIASSDTPLLLLDKDLSVLVASESFCTAFLFHPATMSGRQIFALGAGEWDVPQLRSLLNATISADGSVPAYEMDLKSFGRATRRIVLKARKLDYNDKENIRIILAISDVTDARLAEKLRDDLMRDKAILIQEIQHRVANSLQIIASVLMQGARKVQSEEARSHLHAAHDRVISIAAIQRHLVLSELGDVQLRTYFTQLCETIGASMIADHDRLSVEVAADDSAVDGSVSVSLGLIVTELVINALKHAFPDERHGKIQVDFRSQSHDWTLSVADDGIGMPKRPEGTKAGLGTSIIEALARQLEARINVTDANPGTNVSIIHSASSARVVPFNRAV